MGRTIRQPPGDRREGPATQAAPRRAPPAAPVARRGEKGEPAPWGTNAPGRALDRAHRGVSGGLVGTDLRAHPTAHCCPKELNQCIFSDRFVYRTWSWYPATNWRVGSSGDASDIGRGAHRTDRLRRPARDADAVCPAPRADLPVRVAS